MWFNKKNKHKDEKPETKLLKVIVENSSWITNYWIIGNRLYLTDSQFKNEKTFFGYIEIEDVLLNISKKGFLNPNFIQHPNPVYNSFLVASKTAVKTIDYFNDFLHNVILFDNNFYLSFINRDKKGSYIKVYKDDWTSNEGILPAKFDNYLVTGSYWDHLLLTNFMNGTTFFSDDLSEPFFINKVKKIVEIKDNFVLLSQENKIYAINKHTNEVMIIFDNDEYNITKFDETSILLSIKTENKTYYVDEKNFLKKNYVDSNFFYRLASFNKKILVGKPLFLENKTEDYDQALIFIR